VDRSRLHQALQRGRDHDRPGAAHPARTAGPEDLLLRFALRDHGYPYQLEAWNTNKWTGWTQAPAAAGSAIYNYNNIDTYRNLQPNASAKSSGGAKGILIAIIVVAALVIAGLLAFFLRRGRSRVIEA